METFNLEIAEHHNYFVGLAGILAHNGNVAAAVKSGFSSEERSLTRIYVVVETTVVKGVKREQIIYVGRTLQGEAGNVQKRFTGHLGDKPHWKAKARNLKAVQVDEYLKLSYKAEGKWTQFEAAVWEQHFIDLFGGKLGKLNEYGAKLENDVNAITRDQFKRYRDGYGQNPCRR